MHTPSACRPAEHPALRYQPGIASKDPAGRAADCSSNIPPGVQLYIRTDRVGSGKARLNVRKHGVSFADAVASLEDEGALTMRDPFSDDEERWVTMGRASSGACSLLSTLGALRVCA